MLQRDAKLTKNERDLRRRKIVLRYEKKRRSLEIIIHNLQLPDYVRAHAFKKYQSLPRDSSTTRLKNRCVETGRSKGILRDTKISRIKFREFAHYGILSGLRKSSW